ncbi:MAG: tRNA1Val (adenine37-N6)-methyltransferase [Alphaproteobacteria bacterium]|jgi:tRNA1Val (adenine37-N6)-methyltransferase
MLMPQGTYTVLNGSLKLVDKDSLPRTTADPLWLTEHVNSFKDGETVGDIGSGIGTIALILAQQNPTVKFIGYELDPILVEAACENAQLNTLTNCTFEVMDILKHTPSLTFDHIVSNPPYHNTNKGFSSQNNSKQLAHGSSIEQTKQWLLICLNLTKKGGSCTLMQHCHNLEYIEPLLTEHEYELTYIKTSPKRPAKRVIITIQISKKHP